jgi:histidinol-phosphate aminotransferase
LATAFREQAGELLGIEPDWILAGNGSDDILTIVTRSFAGARDRVRFPYPGYILYETLAQLQDAVPEPISFLPDWGLPAGLGEAAAGLRLVFFANPNSPSGIAYPAERLARLAEMLAVPLVIDEAYVEFADADCLDLVRRFANVIVTRSLSKSYSLAGLRFGYAVARPEMIEGLRKLKDSYNCDALSIAAAAAALRDQDWLRGNIAKIRATRARLQSEMRRLGFTVPDSQTNFVWCTRADRPVRPIYEALKARRILVRYLSYPGWGDGLRVSVGTDQEVETLLRELGTIL